MEKIWIRDPGQNKIPNHLSESLVTIFLVKNTKSLGLWIRIRDQVPFWPWIRMKKFGSGINITDPQHWHWTYQRTAEVRKNILKSFRLQEECLDSAGLK
jgi:hypothetical protein